jgi:pimeloyl-ACP methyl ester carboxylesterase
MRATQPQMLSTTRCSRSTLRAIAVAVALLPCAGVDRARAIELSPCTLPELKAAARCGSINVAENPQLPGSRQLAIHFALVTATQGPALPDPIVPLMGGPGEDAIGAAALYAEQFASLLTNRDLLLVDQRGTGQSAPLHCELFSADQPAASLRDVFPLAAVKRCERTLSKHADLTQYGYLRFSNDLEQVRVALGYGPLNIFAGSYGTRAAAVYMRAHPNSVRTAYLGSVVPIDVAQPLPMARTEEVTLDGVLRACAADAACNRAFPSLRVEFHQVVSQLTAGVSVSVAGVAGKAPLDRGRVAEWIRSRLYRPKGAASVPWLIHRAYLGDWDPIVQGILSGARHTDSDLSLGLLFAITCSEDLPFLDQSDIAAQTRGTFLSEYRVRQQEAACSAWPRASLPTGYRAVVDSQVPTMFVSGDADGVAPLWYTRHAAPGFSERVEVLARGQGHTEWSECVAELYRRFVLSGSTHELGNTVCEPMVRPAFKTE